MSSLREYSSLYHQAVGKKKHLESQLVELTQKQKEQEERFLALEKAQVFLQEVASETQSQLKFHIENIVQMALDAVFPNRYTFKVSFDMKRGKTEARMYLLEGESEVDPMTACGGGVVDIIALALRITAYTLSNTRNVIILDEPMRFVSKDLQPQGAEIIKKLSEKLNIQFIIVTHSTEVIDSADKLFNVQLREGVSYVTER